MNQFMQGLGLVLAAMVLGSTVLFSLVVSPQAFRTLDTGRAKRMIRDTMKRGHPMMAGAAGAAGVLALVGGAFGGAVVMGCAAALFMLAAFTLAPSDDAGVHIVGGKKKRDTARIVAALLTLMITCVVAAGVVLIGMKI